MGRNGRREIQSDLDGVLIDSATPVIAEAGKRLGIRIQKSDLVAFNSVYDIALRITNDPVKAKEISHIWIDSEVLRLAPPVDGCVETVNRWHEKEYGFRGGTSRPPENRRVTLDWFKNNLPVVTRDRIYIRRRGDKRIGDKIKVDLARKNLPDLILEDNADTIRYMAGHLPVELRRGIKMIDAPWNRKDTDLDEIRTTWESLASV